MTKDRGFNRIATHNALHQEAQTRRRLSFRGLQQTAYAGVIAGILLSGSSYSSMLKMASGIMGVAAAVCLVRSGYYYFSYLIAKEAAKQALQSESRKTRSGPKR